MNHTFSNFIVGASNRLAHQAAVTVANHPATAYNPLFIRAAGGLGKTHLLHAIRHHLGQDRPTRQIVYLTPDSLSHKLHNALQNGHIEALRNQYRKTDVLLVDDIQDLTGKNHTQQTLLHILDNLSNSGRQIVMASTTMPQDITPLDLRLRSRLSCGVLVEIRPPEPETRLTILNQKAVAYRLSLSDSMARRIASDTGTSIRELENRLARLATYASLRDRVIDDELVIEMLRQTHPTSAHQVSVIQQTVAGHFGVTVSDIKTRRRDHIILIPRQVAMYLCLELTDMTLPEIGRLFGGRSTTTVQHAYRRIGRLMDRDAGITRAVRVLRKALANTDVDIVHTSFPQGGMDQVCG
jgi:chromosomal replication initiator protein